MAIGSSRVASAVPMTPMGAWHGFGFAGAYDGVRAQHGFGGTYGKASDPAKLTAEQLAQREAAAHAVSGSMMTAAGVAVMQPPPYGWIVAAGLAVTAGTIELVTKILHGQWNKKQIVAAAQQAGIPDAAEVPGFTARALKMSPAKLAKTADAIRKKLGKEHPHRAGKTAAGILTMGLSTIGHKKHASKEQAKNEAKLKILGAVDIIKSAIAQGKMAPPDPAAAAVVEDIAATTPVDPVIAEAGTDPGLSSVIPWVVAGLSAVALLGLIAFAVTRSRKG